MHVGVVAAGFLGGDLRAKAGLSHLRDPAAETDHLVQVRRQRPVEPGRIALIDVIVTLAPRRASIRLK